MFINPSSLALNHIPSASGNVHSAATGPFPESQPLSTPLPSPPNQSTPPSYYIYFPPSSRSPSPSGLPSMTPSRPSNFPSDIGPIIPPSQSNPSVPTVSDLPEPTTDIRASTGTSVPPPATSSSDSGVSASLTSWSAASGITSSANSSSPSLSHSTNPPSMSGLTFTSTPMSTTPFSTTSTTSPPAIASSSLSLSTGLPFPISSTLSSASTITWSSSATPDSITTVFLSTTVVTPVSSFSSSSLNSPSTSTYTITSVLGGQGATTTNFVTTSSVLSTEPPSSIVDRTLSPGTIAAIVLGIFGAFSFSILWLFCARRRHRKLVREATFVQPEHHAPGPLDDEIQDVDELGYGVGSTHSAENPANLIGPAMEERYASILAALHSTERIAKVNEGGSTGGIYGSRHDTATDMDEDITRASSPTLPLHILPDGDVPPHMVPLSPPPPVLQPSHNQIPPPSAYYTASRRKSSPGPDAAAWLSGYSVAPSCHSQYARSQTLGSGSGSGSVDALTRTRTGSEEPLLGIAKAIPEAPPDGGTTPTTATDPEGNRTGLGSAFGSPATSMYSPNSAYPTLQYDTPGSRGTRTASGSESYGYAHSGAPSSFDALRSVSSQGALSSAYSQGHGQSQGFRFGFNRGGSLSSNSTGRKAGSNQFGVPPTSFRTRKDQSSIDSDKEKSGLGEKQSLREKDWKPRPRSWTSTSASGSADEKQGRASPVIGVRALLGRLRRAGHTPSPHSSNNDLPSPTKASTDVDPEKTAANRVTPPPIQVEAALPQRRRFSFILSNPDPHPPSPYSGVDVIPSSVTPPYQERRLVQYGASSDFSDCKLVAGSDIHPTMAFPTRHMFGHAPSPAPTDESRLAEGLLHPRLRTQGHSDASLRDFEDYSRPIGGVVKNRLYSTTTIGTQDGADRCPSQGTLVHDVPPSDEHDDEDDNVFGASARIDVPRDSWFVDDRPPPTTARHSLLGS